MARIPFQLLYWLLTLLFSWVVLRHIERGKEYIVFLALAVWVVYWITRPWRNRRALRQRDLIRRGLCPTCGQALATRADRCAGCRKKVPHGSTALVRDWKLIVSAREILEALRAECDAPAHYIPVVEQAPSNGTETPLHQELQTAGFRMLGRMRNTTDPGSASVRSSHFWVYLDPSGTIAAIARFGEAGDALTLDLDTELSDGTFVESSARKAEHDAWGEPSIPAITHRRLWATPRLETLLPLHVEEIERWKKGAAVDPYPLARASLEDCCESFNRSVAVRTAHLKSIGYVDRAMMVGYFNGGLLPWEERLVTELERVKQANGLSR